MEVPPEDIRRALSSECPGAMCAEGEDKETAEESVPPGPPEVPGLADEIKAPFPPPIESEKFASFPEVGDVASAFFCTTEPCGPAPPLSEGDDKAPSMAVPEGAAGACSGFAGGIHTWEGIDAATPNCPAKAL